MENNKIEVVDKSIVTLSDLIARSRDIESRCTDYMVTKSSTAMNFRYNTNGCFEFTDSNTGEFKELKASDWARSQIGIRLNIPAGYIDKCEEAGFNDLAVQNMNTWIDKYNKSFFIRAYENHIRGFLSPRYTACDTSKVLTTLGDVVNPNDYKIKGSFINEERTHIRLIGTEKLHINNEDLFPALFFDTSDVGRKTLIIRFGIYKLVCTNGMVVAKAGGIMYQQRHISIDQEEFYETIVANLKNIDILKENAEKWVMATKAKPTLTMDEMLSQLKNTFKFDEKKSAKVIELMDAHYENNKWGYLNAITEVAQDFTLERRIEIERQAGNLLMAA